MDSISRAPEDVLKLADLDPEIVVILQSRPPMPASLPNLTVLRNMYEKQNQHYLSTLVPNPPTDVGIDDRVIPNKDNSPIPIRIYRPTSATAPGPLIITIHGGAKVMGTLTDSEAHCLLLAQKFNATCINIDYRLAPEHKSPALINDCWDIVQWAASNASSLHADPRKGFLLLGSSSGATVADILAHMSRDTKLDPPITGVVSICPSPCAPNAIPAQYAPEFLSWNQDMSGGLPKAALAQFAEWAGTSAEPADPLNSPLLWPTGHKELCSVFFQIHGRDWVRDAGLIYERVLREEAGVETRLKVYPGGLHGFNVSFPGTKLARKHEEDTMEGVAWLLSLVKGEYSV